METYVTVKPNYRCRSTQSNTGGLGTLNKEGVGYHELVSERKKSVGFCDTCPPTNEDNAYRVTGLSGVVKAIWVSKNGACPRCGRYLFYSNKYRKEPDNGQKWAVRLLN